MFLFVCALEIYLVHVSATFSNNLDLLQASSLTAANNTTLDFNVKSFQDKHNYLPRTCPSGTKQMNIPLPYLCWFVQISISAYNRVSFKKFSFHALSE